MGRISGLAVALALVRFTGPAYGQSDAPPDAKTFAQRLRGLDPKNGKEARLEALRWISQHADGKNAAQAAAALERCMRDDPDVQIRQRAVAERAQLARRLGQPCPLAVLETLNDPVDFVRWEAAVWAGLSKTTYAPGSLEIVLRGVKSDRPDVRTTCLLLLPRVGGTDAKALDAIRKATKDPVFDVRHSAHIALFRVHNRLDEYLPYLIRVREDPAAVLGPVPADPAAAKKERELRNVFVIGMAIQLIEWRESRADEMAAVLMKLLGDKSAVMRRGAANLIAVSVVKVELAPQRGFNPLDFATSPKDGMFRILPYVTPGDGGSQSSPFLTPSDPLSKNQPGRDPKSAEKRGKEARPKERREKSSVALRLEKLHVQDRLRQLRDNDLDASVLAAARRALEQLASFNAKK